MPKNEKSLKNAWKDERRDDFEAAQRKLSTTKDNETRDCSFACSVANCTSALHYMYLLRVVAGSWVWFLRAQSIALSASGVAVFTELSACVSSFNCLQRRRPCEQYSMVQVPSNLSTCTHRHPSTRCTEICIHCNQSQYNLDIFYRFPCNLRNPASRRGRRRRRGRARGWSSSQRRWNRNSSLETTIEKCIIIIIPPEETRDLKNTNLKKKEVLRAECLKKLSEFFQVSRCRTLEAFFREFVYNDCRKCSATIWKKQSFYPSETWVFIWKWHIAPRHLPKIATPTKTKLRILQVARNCQPWPTKKLQNYVNRVDLVKSFLTSIHLQKSASIQPKTSPWEVEIWNLKLLVFLHVFSKKRSALPFVRRYRK